MRTHFVSQEKYDRAIRAGIGGILRLRPICGAKATRSGQLDLQPGNWDGVDCVRCLTHRPS
jgi:hypothetical protein